MRKILNLIMGNIGWIFSMVSAFLFWVFKKDDKVQLVYVYIIIVIFIIISIIQKIYYENKCSEKNDYLIKKIIKKSNNIYFLINSNEIITQDMLLEIVYIDNDIEECFSLGIVQNAKNNSGYAQINAVLITELGKKLIEENENLDALKTYFRIRFNLTEKLLLEVANVGRSCGKNN